MFPDILFDNKKINFKKEFCKVSGILYHWMMYYRLCRTMGEMEL